MEWQTLAESGVLPKTMKILFLGGIFLAEEGSSTSVQKQPVTTIADYYRNLRPNVYNAEGIDRIIISNSVDANTILRKFPHLVKKPVFRLDSRGKKIPISDEKGNFVVDQSGLMQFVIDGYEDVQDGFETRVETCPASEVFSPDMTSTNLNQEQYMVVMDLIWEYNYLQVLQSITKKDYSFEIHQLRNDINAIIVPAKSLYAGAVQAVKTFRTVTEGKQENISAEQKKPSAFDKIVQGIKGGAQQSQSQSQQPYYVRK